MNYESRISKVKLQILSFLFIQTKLRLLFLNKVEPSKTTSVCYVKTFFPVTCPEGTVPKVHVRVIPISDELAHNVKVKLL